DIGCNAFSQLLRVDDGLALMPVLPFSGYTDVASGSFSDANTAARREFDALRDRVGPISAEVRSAGSADKQLLRYSLEGQRYRANIPVSPVELPNVWTALSRLSENDPNVSLSLDNSIGVSITAAKTPQRNAVNPGLKLEHPVYFRDQICVRSDMASHYAM